MTKVYENEGAEFEPASEDIHNAVCCEFQDIGVQEGPYGSKHQGLIVFQVEEMNDMDPPRRKEVRWYFTMTLGTAEYPSNLRKYAEAWRGKPFVPEDIADGFDPELLVGKPCRLAILHKTSKKGRTYAFIDSLMKAGEKKIEPLDYKPLAERGQKDDDNGSTTEDDDQVPF